MQSRREKVLNRCTRWSSGDSWIPGGHLLRVLIWYLCLAHAAQQEWRYEFQAEGGREDSQLGLMSTSSLVLKCGDTCPDSLWPLSPGTAGPWHNPRIQGRQLAEQEVSEDPAAALLPVGIRSDGSGLIPYQVFSLSTDMQHTSLKPSSLRQVSYYRSEFCRLTRLGCVDPPQGLSCHCRQAGLGLVVI